MTVDLSPLRKSENARLHTQLRDHVRFPLVRARSTHSRASDARPAVAVPFVVISKHPRV